jgi:peroxiredoxin
MKKVIVLFAGLLYLYSANAQSGYTTNAQAKQSMVGQAAPPFELKSLDGKTESLAGLKGSYVVLHFATTWCPFCAAEAPHLEQLHQDYRDKNVQVLLIDVKEDQALVERLSAKFNFTFPVLLDSDGSVATRYAPEGVLPDLARDEVPLASNLIIDKQGKIRFYSLLNTTNFDARLNSLKQKLDELLATKDPK